MFDLEKTDSGQKVNAFIDIKGVPYLCGYYLNNISFQTLSATQVQNEISIDNTIEGRTLVNIELDQLDHDDQGLILPTGNVEKREQLEQMVMNYRDYIGLNSFEVLKNGLVVQINYRIEDQVTGRVVKVMTDSYTIYNAGFYSFVGNTNIADPAVVIKFSDSAVAAINQFSYGIQNLVLRINSIHLYYASVPSVRKRRPLYYPPHYAYGYPVPSPASAWAPGPYLPSSGTVSRVSRRSPRGDCRPLIRPSLSSRPLHSLQASLPVSSLLRYAHPDPSRQASLPSPFPQALPLPW